MTIQFIDAGNFMCDGGAIFGVVPKKLWEKQYPANENNFCNLSMRCLLVTDENRKILIETGIGTKQSEKFLSHYHLNGNATLEKSLTLAQVHPHEITDVILTHLHFDHCGGCISSNNTEGLIINFPKATFWVSEQQWQNYLNPNPREGAVYFPENMMEIAKQNKLKQINETYQLTSTIELRLFHGHTPGQIIPFINYKKETLVYMADLIPVMASIPLSWVSAYDVQPLQSLKEKELFLNEAANNNYVLVFEHDLYNECCRVIKTEKGIKATESFSLNTLNR